MWKVLTVFCAFCAVGKLQEISSSKHVSVSDLRVDAYSSIANKLFDGILSIVSKSKEIDPVALPNTSFHFKTRFIAKITAEASLSRGILEGLSTLHRTGDCRLEIGERGIDVEADVGAGPLNASFVGIARALGYGQAVTVDADVLYLQIRIGLLQLPGKPLELSKFEVQQLKGLTVAIRGLGFLSVLFNKVSAEITNLFEKQIKNAIEKNVPDALAEHIGKLNDVFSFRKSPVRLGP